MNIKDVQTQPERRAFANAVAVVVVLALVSLALEIMARWGISEIIGSLASFGIILFFAGVRFLSRSNDPGDRERLWITAVWNLAIDVIARQLPASHAAPPPNAPGLSPNAPPADPPAQDGSGREVAPY
ncbi:MAG TPA: hypothetical protein VEX86_26155 [Longimicrobium sp.]|nr:hypothetical protein [Longimicrobium sp.]